MGRQMDELLRAEVDRVGSRAADEVINAPLPRLTYTQRALAGDPDAAQYLDDIRSVRAGFADEAVQHADRSAEFYRNLNVTATYGGLGVDAANAGKDIYDALTSERQIKANSYSRVEVGSTW